MANHDQNEYDEHETRIVAARLIPHPMYRTPRNKRRPHVGEWRYFNKLFATVGNSQ